MGNWSCDQQVCASCRYWSGRRDMDFTASFFDAKDEQGRCNGPASGFRGADMWDSSSCNEWETFRTKW